MVGENEAANAASAAGNNVISSLTTFSLPWWAWLAAAVILVVLAVVVLKKLKNLLVNAVLGVLALLAINFFGSAYGLKIEVNLLSVIISALLGLAGVGALVILALLGIRV